MKKYFLIYKTTNQINQKFYIGKHETTDLNDGYLGSGIAITAAIKKYGKINFKREILHVFDNKKLMESKEKELLSDTVLQNPQCYNIALGGQGGNLGSTVNQKIGIAMSIALKGKSKSDSHKAALSKSNTGRRHSDSVKQKISKTVSQNWKDLSVSQRKEKFGHPAERNGFFGKAHSAETKAKIKETIGDSRKGSQHHCAKPTIINGVTYKSRVECMQDLGINKRQLYKILGE